LTGIVAGSAPWATAHSETRRRAASKWQGGFRCIAGLPMREGAWQYSAKGGGVTAGTTTTDDEDEDEHEHEGESTPS
jgi:hypothetical protein